MNKGKKINKHINAEAELMRILGEEINKSIIKGIEEEVYKEKLRTIKNRFDQKENNDNNL